MIYAIFALLAVCVCAVALSPSWRTHRNGCIAAGTGCVALSLGLYAMLGSPQLLPLLEAHHEKIETIKQSLTTHAQTIKNDPANLPAWVALGQGFAETGQWKQASNAFREAVLLSGGNPKLILAYAKSLIFAEDGKVGERAKQSLEVLLLEEPGNPEARYFLAVRQLQDGNTENAMKAMKALYASLPDDSPVKVMIDRQIGRK